MTAKSEASAEIHHLILGGSRGIGFAYAQAVSRRAPKSSIQIIARDVEQIDQAVEKLSAQHDGPISGACIDLTQPDQRLALWDTVRRGDTYTSVFLGGPGPQPVRAATAKNVDIVRAYDICVRFPSEVFDRAHDLLAVGGRIFWLSSAASQEPLRDSPFYLSGAFRRITDQLVVDHRDRLRDRGISIHVLRPRVVLTSLSIAYGKKLADDGMGTDAESALRLAFGVDQIETAEEYVAREMFLLDSHQ